MPVETTNLGHPCSKPSIWYKGMYSENPFRFRFENALGCGEEQSFCEQAESKCQVSFIAPSQPVSIVGIPT